MRRGKCKYNFPHSERFPKSIYSQHPDKTWIYIKRWDGRFAVDSNQLAQTDKFKEQCRQMRQYIGSLR